MNYPKPAPDVNRLLSVDEVCGRLSIGRTVLFRAMHPDAGYRRGLPRLRSVTLGGRRLVPSEALREFIAQLEKQAGE